jgi:hypothetical protein
LADDLRVGESDNESVLGRVVFILILDDQSLSGIIIGLPFSSPAVLGLESLEIGRSLDVLDKCHGF